MIINTLREKKKSILKSYLKIQTLASGLHARNQLEIKALYLLSGYILKLILHILTHH